MEFSKQEYWNMLPFPSSRDLPNPEIKPGSLALQADFLPSEPPGKLIGLLVFFILKCMSCLYILEINPLPISFANIFSYSEGCLFFLLMVSFAEHVLKQNSNLKRHMHPNIHGSTIYNNQDMEAT